MKRFVGGSTYVYSSEERLLKNYDSSKNFNNSDAGKKTFEAAEEGK